MASVSPFSAPIVDDGLLFRMIQDDSGLLMIIDDYWWLLITIDYYWWLLMIIDDYWYASTWKNRKKETPLFFETVSLFRVWHDWYPLQGRAIHFRCEASSRFLVVFLYFLNCNHWDSNVAKKHTKTPNYPTLPKTCLMALGILWLCILLCIGSLQNSSAALQLHHFGTMALVVRP